MDQDDSTADQRQQDNGEVQCEPMEIEGDQPSLSSQEEDPSCDIILIAIVPLLHWLLTFQSNLYEPAPASETSVGGTKSPPPVSNRAKKRAKGIAGVPDEIILLVLKYVFDMPDGLRSCTWLGF